MCTRKKAHVPPARLGDRMRIARHLPWLPSDRPSSQEDAQSRLRSSDAASTPPRKVQAEEGATAFVDYQAAPEAALNRMVKQRAARLARETPLAPAMPKTKKRKPPTV